MNHVVDKKLAFLVCGAQKSGTTALAAYLRQHPEIFLPEEKELHFFDDETQSWPNANWDELHSKFANALPNQQWGEATPISMYWDAAPERIWSYNPKMRLIAVLRNPIERAYSHWTMEKSRNAELLSFEEALQREEERSREALPKQHRVFSYTDRGFYSSQIKRLWRFFGKDQVLVLRHENLRLTPDICLKSIWDHLGLNPEQNIKPLERHTSNYEEPMSIKAHQRLRKIYWHEISQLEALLNWDCSNWLRKIN